MAWCVGTLVIETNETYHQDIIRTKRCILKQQYEFTKYGNYKTSITHSNNMKFEDPKMFPRN
jgi:hypothetical protein